MQPVLNAPTAARHSYEPTRKKESFLVSVPRSKSENTYFFVQGPVALNKLAQGESIPVIHTTNNLKATQLAPNGSVSVVQLGKLTPAQIKTLKIEGPSALPSTVWSPLKPKAPAPSTPTSGIWVEKSTQGGTKLVDQDDEQEEDLAASPLLSYFAKPVSSSPDVFAERLRVEERSAVQGVVQRLGLVAGRIMLVPQGGLARDKEEEGLFFATR